VALFITLEGGEGAGKSTQSLLLAQKLQQAVRTREPGGTVCAEWLRGFILSGKAKAWGSEAEAVLFAAARLDHVERVIKPALAHGKHVVCDRFIDSTFVYQGLTGQTSLDLLNNLQQAAIGGCAPHLTLILDIPVELGMARARARSGVKDRFEAEAQEFHHKLREGFLLVARDNPTRCVVINAAQNQDRVEADIWQAVKARL
jgi:dTMP kinase